MSNAIFPTLAGLGWNILKVPEFNTKVQRSVNLSELRASFSNAPIYNYTLHFDLLRDDVTHNEVKNLIGFFLARYGSWDSFLYSDPDDSEVAGQALGIGDGAETAFQLVRSYGAQTENVCNIETITEVTVANTPTGNFTASSTGLITFTAAPAANAVIAWTGSYYHRCRFTADTQDFNQFMRQLWEVRSLEFRGSLGVKI